MNYLFRRTWSIFLAFDVFKCLNVLRSLMKYGSRGVSRGISVLFSRPVCRQQLQVQCSMSNRIWRVTLMLNVMHKSTASGCGTDLISDMPDLFCAACSIRITKSAGDSLYRAKQPDWIVLIWVKLTLFHCVSDYRLLFHKQFCSVKNKSNMCICLSNKILPLLIKDHVMKSV